jgi:AcrR family transcriptional regulator
MRQIHQFSVTEQRFFGLTGRSLAWTSNMSKPQQKSRPQALRQALQEQTRAAYREAILDAAERIFLRDGFQSAKMVDVAEATGVSVGTLYNYFDSKDAVFLALVERHRTRHFEMLSAPFAASNAIGKLHEFAERTMRFVEDNGALFAVYLRNARNAAGHALPHAHGVNPEDDHRRYSAVVSSLLADGIKEGSLRDDLPLENMTWVLRSLLQTAVLEWVGSNAPNSLVARGQSLVQLFLEGASRK